MAFPCNTFGGFPSKLWYIYNCCKPSFHTPSSSSSVCTCSTCPRVCGQHRLQEALLLRVCSIKSPGKRGNGLSASSYPQEFHRASGLGTQSISWWETEWRLLERPFSFKLIEDIFSGKGTGASPWLGFSLGNCKAKVQVSGLPDSSPASP